MRVFQVIVFYISYAIININTSAQPLLYTGHFVAGIEGGRERARQVATAHGLRLLDTRLWDDLWHLTDARAPKLSIRPALNLTRTLASDPLVTWVEQQTLKSRHLKRSLTSPAGCSQSQRNETKTWKFNDPLFPQQWYLFDGEVSVHVDEVWSLGLTGKGVTLFVLDDGVQAENTDIADNYESRGGADISEIWQPLPKPAPRSTDDAHGTYCAAIMAGVAGNGFCGVGAAFDAKVGGVKLLGTGPVSDLQEALALSLWQGVGDIASASWGPKDNGASVDGPGPLASAALRRAVTKGRGGKGAILVWAAGNGGLRGDHCNLDGYASSMYTLTVGALTQTGASCPYSEPCAAVLTSVFVRGGQGSHLMPSVLNGGCRDNFEGTSAAAPLAAGVIALALQAHPKVTWREVQHAVVVSSAPPANYLEDPSWRVNSAGRYFHPQQGFGALHAVKLVKEVNKFTFQPLRAQNKASFSVQTLPIILKGDGSTIVKILVSGVDIRSIEHVVATLTVNHPKRRKLEMFIISPAGTKSNILSRRHLDMKKCGFKNWPFLSVNFWGEKCKGVWKIVINNKSTQLGQINRLVLNIYGTA